MISLDFPFEFDECQLRVSEKKLNMVQLPISIREFHDIRARGGSKTFDTMCLALYLASIGYEGIWFAAHSKQMEQPKKYLKKIVERSYLKYLLSDLLKESVSFETDGRLEILNLTEDNARSPRADFIIFDELARAEEDAYNASGFILSVTQLGLIINISTPCKATIEEKRYDILKRREIIHNEELVSELWWNDISFLARKKDWYDEQRRLLPGWYFRQENECSHEFPMGAVFQNVEYDVYQEVNNEWILKHDIILSPVLVSGIDWNPVSGHWCVGGHWLENMRGFLVTHAIPIAVGYSHKLKEEAYLTIKKYAVHKKRLCMESGGINEEYVDWFKEWFGKDRAKRDVHVLYEDWDSAGINKINSVLSLLDKTIYVDRIRFPELAKQIENCRWDSDSDVPRLDKDPVDSPHALDAFLHAVNKRLLKEIGLRRFDWYGST